MCCTKHARPGDSVVRSSLRTHGTSHPALSLCFPRPSKLRTDCKVKDAYKIGKTLGTGGERDLHAAILCKCHGCGAYSGCSLCNAQPDTRLPDTSPARLGFADPCYAQLRHFCNAPALSFAIFAVLASLLPCMTRFNLDMAPAGAGPVRVAVCQRESLRSWPTHLVTVTVAFSGQSKAR